MMKWGVRLVGLIGLAWGTLTTLYAVAVVLLAPLAVRTDSADFRNAIIWLSGSILFMTAYLFIYIYNLLLQRQRFQSSAIICGIISIIILLTGLSTMDIIWRLALTYYGAPIVCWCIIVLYLTVAQQNKKADLA